MRPLKSVDGVPFDLQAVLKAVAEIVEVHVVGCGAGCIQLSDPARLG